MTDFANALWSLVAAKAWCFQPLTTRLVGLWRFRSVPDRPPWLSKWQTMRLRTVSGVHQRNPVAGYGGEVGEVVLHNVAAEATVS